MADTVDPASVTVIGGEFAPVNQLPIELEANINAIKTRTQNAVANADMDKDFDFSRTNLIQILNNGLAAVEELTMIARQSQHPRAYEVLALLLKNLSDTNDKLLDLHEKKMSLSQSPDESGEGTDRTFKNNIFVGSTSELLQLINKNKTNG